MILFSMDLEDHTKRYEPSGRYIENTLRVLDYLDARNITGTFFIVGLVAKHAPSLVRTVAERGHEIACHSFRHRVLTDETAEEFRDDTRNAKEILEQVSGTSVTGYRAPIFSLTRKSAWACDVLAELGFAYSSSTLPAASPLFGFPGLPSGPFRWEAGVVELPCPVARVGPLHVPFLGGIYLRYLPRWAIARWIRQAGAEAVLWTYVHPFDFDPAEPFLHIPGTNRLTSFLLWRNRRDTFEKLAWLFARDGSQRFCDVVGTLAGDPSLPCVRL